MVVIQRPDQVGRFLGETLIRHPASRAFSYSSYALYREKTVHKSALAFDVAVAPVLGLVIL